jgi:hypothetical protein
MINETCPSKHPIAGAVLQHRSRVLVTRADLAPQFWAIDSRLNKALTVAVPPLNNASQVPARAL